MITIAHAHKSGVIFHFFQELSNNKKKALRPKMTKIASRGGGEGPAILILLINALSAVLLDVAEEIYFISFD